MTLPPIIARLREASAKATKGPWQVESKPNPVGEIMHELDAIRPPRDDFDTRLPLAMVYGDNAVWLPEGEDYANAGLIALTRNNIDSLLKAMEAAMKEIEAWREADLYADMIGQMAGDYDQMDPVGYGHREVIRAARPVTDLALRELGECK
jgi:hypothetical protein